MSALEDKINSLLSNPEEMGKLAKMAAKLMDGGLPENSAPQKDPEESGLDPSMMATIGKVMKGLGGGGGGRKDLVSALCPYLEDSRRRRLEKAIRMAQVVKVAGSAFSNSEAIGMYNRYQGNTAAWNVWRIGRPSPYRHTARGLAAAAADGDGKPAGTLKNRPVRCMPSQQSGRYSVPSGPGEAENGGLHCLAHPLSLVPRDGGVGVSDRAGGFCVPVITPDPPKTRPIIPPHPYRAL